MVSKTGRDLETFGGDFDLLAKLNKTEEDRLPLGHFIIQFLGLGKIFKILTLTKWLRWRCVGGASQGGRPPLSAQLR